MKLKDGLWFLKKNCCMKWLYCLPNDKVKLGAKWTIIIASNDETRFERCRGSAMTSRDEHEVFRGS